MSVAGGAIGQENKALVETRQITVRLLVSHPATDIYLSSGTPGGYGWLFPKADVANLGAGVSPPFRSRLAGIVARLHRNLHRQGKVGDEVLAMTGGAIPVGGMLQPWGQLGAALVLLAGDAAGLTNPVTGAGIAAAVASGRLAGELAAAAVGGASAVGERYGDELASTYGAALDRALRRRRELMTDVRGVSKAALRRSWIAYPEYWAA
jgi:digeranylgeranylglycerophospholipid reductase